jgi:DNA-binding NtrC family response regulator
MSDQSRLPMVSAFFAEDFSKMKALGEEIHKNDPLFQYYRAIGGMYDSKITSEQKDDFIRTALSDPPKDVELFILLLYSLVLFSVQNGRMNNAHQAVELMKQLSRVGVKTEVKVSVLRSEQRIHQALDHYDEELDCLSRALKYFRPGEKMWAVLKTNRIRSAIENEDFEVVRSDLEELQPYSRLVIDSRSGSYEILKAYYLYSCAKYQEAWNAIQTFPSGESNASQRGRLFIKILCLIQNMRWEEVSELLDTVAKNLQEIVWPLPSYQDHQLLRCEYEYLRSHAALAQKKLELARQHAQNGVTVAANSTPRLRREGQHLLLWVDLAMGHSRAARVLLNQLDPNESKRVYASEWTRLHFLEGNAELAASHFKTIIHTGIPEFIEHKLRYAYELSAGQTTTLFTKQSSKREKSLPVIKPEIFIHEKEDLKLRFPMFSGNSKIILDFWSLIEKLSRLHTTIFISGELGTYRSQVARMLHLKSLHSKELFLPVLCGTTSDILLESEIFGHVKGAFTGASSNRMGSLVQEGKATVFLDQIHLLSPQLQSKILHTLEHHAVKPIGGSKFIPTNARIIVGASQPIDKVLRKDLYHLVSRVQIRIPPLRERTEDIPGIAYSFLKSVYSKSDFVIADDLMDAFKSYSWPRNFTELGLELKRVALAAGNSQILTASLFKPGINAAAPSTSNISMPVTPLPLTSAPRLATASSETEVAYSHYRMNRQQKLKDLFSQKDKLTRADVSRILGCSPNTAASDLKLLEAEGYIQRMNPSTSARLSYFVRVSR